MLSSFLIAISILLTSSIDGYDQASILSIINNQQSNQMQGIGRPQGYGQYSVIVGSRAPLYPHSASSSSASSSSIGSSLSNSLPLALQQQQQQLASPDVMLSNRGVAALSSGINGQQQIPIISGTAPSKQVHVFGYSEGDKTGIQQQVQQVQGQQVQGQQIQGQQQYIGASHININNNRPISISSAGMNNKVLTYPGIQEQQHMKSNRGDPLQDCDENGNPIGKQQIILKPIPINMDMIPSIMSSSDSNQPNMMISPIISPQMSPPTAAIPSNLTTTAPPPIVPSLVPSASPSPSPSPSPSSPSPSPSPSSPSSLPIPIQSALNDNSTINAPWKLSQLINLTDTNSNGSSLNRDNTLQSSILNISSQNSTYKPNRRHRRPRQTSIPSTSPSPLFSGNSFDTPSPNTSMSSVVPDQAIAASGNGSTQGASSAIGTSSQTKTSKTVSDLIRWLEGEPEPTPSPSPIPTGDQPSNDYEPEVSVHDLISWLLGQGKRHYNDRKGNIISQTTNHPSNNGTMNTNNNADSVSDLVNTLADPNSTLTAPSDSNTNDPSIMQTTGSTDIPMNNAN